MESKYPGQMSLVQICSQLLLVIVRSQTSQIQEMR